MFILSPILYAILGVLLGVAGITVIQNTAMFFSIMLTVLAIDIVSMVRASK